MRKECSLLRHLHPERGAPQRRLLSFVPTPHAGEIIVMRENGLEIRRVALSRSVFFPNAGYANYWATPRAAISADGSLVVSDSNFGQAGGRASRSFRPASVPSQTKPAR